jgi:hypothetical protein
VEVLKESGRTDQEHYKFWLSPSSTDGLYLKKTTYSLLTPLAYIPLLERQLTPSDLRSYENINFQYLVASILYNSLTETPRIARNGDKLEYSSHYDGKDKKEKRSKEPARYSVQGIYQITLDIVVDYFIKNEAVMSISTFLDNYGDRFTPQQKLDDLKKVINLFRDFHPNKKPILWRSILIQLCLYRMLEKIRYEDIKIRNFKSFDDMKKSFKDIYEFEDQLIEWRNKNYEQRMPGIDKKPLAAVQEYIDSKLERIYNENEQRQK